MLNQQEQTIFFELIRSALWEREPDLSVFRGDWDWSAILTAFADQELIGVIASVVNSLPDHLQPEERQSILLFNIVANLISTHYRLNQAIVDVTSQFDSLGIPSVLLKGQGLATLYPRNAIRSCGDIDIYVPRAYYDEAYHLVDSYCGIPYREITNHDRLFHSHFMKKGDINFEIHVELSHPAVPEVEEDLNTWSKTQVVPNLCEQVNINGKAICVPATFFNCIFVFNHLCHHYRHEGLGFRPLIDWMLLLHKWNKEIAGEKRAAQILEFREVLNRYFLLDAWQIFGGILVYQLGLPQAEFPLWDTKKAKLSQNVILNRIINEGYYGHSDYKVKGYDSQTNRLHRAYSSFRYYAPIFWYEYTLFPRDTIKKVARQFCTAIRK